MAKISNKSRLMGLMAALLLVLVACNDRTDEAAQGQPDAGHDVGDEAQGHYPTAETIDFDDAQPGEPTRTHITSSSRRAVVSADPPLVADRFLSLEDARAFIPNTALSRSTIAGQSPSSTYNSLRYAPVDDSAHFGVGLQIWRLDDETPAQERLSELRAQFLNVAIPTHADAPSGSFVSERAGLRTFVVPSADERHLFALTCGLEHCSEWAQLYELGLEIAARD